MQDDLPLNRDDLIAAIETCDCEIVSSFEFFFLPFPINPEFIQLVKQSAGEAECHSEGVLLLKFSRARASARLGRWNDCVADFADSCFATSPLKAEAEAYTNVISLEMQSGHSMPTDFHNLNGEMKKPRISYIADIEKRVGNVLFGQKYYELSIKYYSYALTLDPSMSTAFCNRAAATAILSQCMPRGSLQLLSAFTGAIRDCTNAIRLDKNYIKAYIRRAQLWSKLKIYKSSHFDYKIAMKLSTKSNTVVPQEIKQEYRQALFRNQVCRSWNYFSLKMPSMEQMENLRTNEQFISFLSRGTVKSLLRLLKRNPCYIPFLMENSTNRRTLCQLMSFLNPNFTPELELAEARAAALYKKKSSSYTPTTTNKF
ncbi:hypothetical protein Pelo_11810 [Pelomyxa schiedti]|nr:hypothetical protein Pelo_11810 [Pelomyxa schiedti]